MKQFIIETITSKRDINGNCYHFAIITSTLTGRQLMTQVNGDSNATAMVKRLLDLDWSDIHYSGHVLPIREWGHRRKNVDLYEHNVTAEMLNELNVSE